MTTDTAAFLAARFPDLGPEEYVEGRTFHPDGQPGPRFWDRDPARLARRALALPAGLAVYYGVNPRREGGGKKADVTSITAAVADIDFKHFADGRAGTLAAVDAFPLPPTWLIDSGGGLQAYWQLAAPLRLAGPTDPTIARFEGLQSRMYVQLGGLDSVQDIPRVLRVPGTLNHKYDPPRPVTIVAHHPAAVYTLEDLAAALPAPEPAPAPAPFPTHPPRADDTPPVEEVREMLRRIPPRGDYKDHWLRLLAAVHSAYPGPEGVALCEEWSPGRPGEIARKFASFGGYQGARGQATIATLIYEARQHGYERPRPIFAASAAPGAGTSHGDLSSRLAEVEREVAALRRETAEQAVALEQCGAARTRLEQENAGLRAEVALLEACIAHPDQTLGVAALDIFDAAQAAYARGDVITQDGEDYCRLVKEKAENRRSASTIGRAVAKLKESGAVKVITRKETIEGDRFKGPVNIDYLCLPTAMRRDRGEAVRYLHGHAPEKKVHGGDRTVPVPPEVTAQEAPVRRELRQVARFFSLVDDRHLGTLDQYLRTDYCAADGTVMTTEEAEAYQARIGAKPRTPAYRPVQSRRQDAGKGTKSTCPQDAGGAVVDFSAAVDTRPQDASGPEPALLVNRGCRIAACGTPPTRGGYCDRHHPDAWRDALDLRERPPRGGPVAYERVVFDA